MKERIPFNKPYLSGNELEYISDAVESGHISGDGLFTKKCSDYLQATLEVPKVLMTTSCTHALEMAAILLDIKSGDEVILPSFTFVSTANAFALHGAKPIFVDIRQDTLNIDEDKIEGKITDRTKAIVLVHYAGTACEMDKIMAISKKYNIPIVEDNAHGLFAKYKDKYLSSFGAFGTTSFHETKNFISGEGGALIINNEKYIERAEIIREKGTDRTKFFHGEVDKYTWQDVGSSFLPSDILSAYLYAQLENKDMVLSEFKNIYQRYQNSLKELENKGYIQLPVFTKDCTPSYSFFYILVKDKTTRDELISFLNEENIHSVFHYLPLHLSPFCKRFGYAIGDLPNTEKASDTIIRLPFFISLDKVSQEYIVNKIKSFFNNK